MWKGKPGFNQVFVQSKLDKIRQLGRLGYFSGSIQVLSGWVRLLARSLSTPRDAPALNLVLKRLFSVSLEIA